MSVLIKRHTGFGSTQCNVSIVPPGAGVTVAWDAANKDTDINLSNGDLTAHFATDDNYGVGFVRATAQATGKKYWRCVWDDIAGTDTILYVGVVKAATAVTTNLEVAAGGVVLTGANATQIALANIHIDGVYSADGPQTLAVNDIIDIACDIDNLRIWFRKNGTGSWFPGDDPAANTNGSVLASDTWYPCFGGRNGSGVTARFANDGSGTAPSGFSWLG